MTGAVVALAGPPGSGKSTAGRLVAAELGLEFVSAGELFRAEAARQGMGLDEFSGRAERDPEIDRNLDARMLRLARPGRLLEGRLVGATCRRNGVPAHYVVVTARPEVRFQRLSERDHQDLPTARRLTEAREASERGRYRRYYNIDLDQESPDLVVDSSESPPEAVAGEIVRFLRSARAGGSF